MLLLHIHRIYHCSQDDEESQCLSSDEFPEADEKIITCNQRLNKTEKRIPQLGAFDLPAPDESVTEVRAFLPIGISVQCCPIMK